MFSDKVIALDASSALNTTETFSSVLSILNEYLSSSKFSFHLAHLILLCVVALFYFLELRVCVNEKGINYQFFPFHLKSYVIKYDEIESYLSSLHDSPLHYRPFF